MSKKKRSKILATLLCATTMAAFYASPQIGYAVSLNQKEDGTVTTDSGGTNTAIHNIEGIESITFGVQGDMETGGVNLYFDGTGTYGGLVANGSLTATDLYITVENNADGDNYNSNRYSLKNALGIHRTGTGDKAITNIEANSQGHGGMQVSSDTVSILDGAAVFTNTTTSDNGGTISFSSAFNSEQGMTVGTNFVLDSTGKISKVNGIEVQGALITTGTINSMTIGNNQVNGVTLNNGNVTANEVTVGSYKLSEVGSLANTINQKTMGIASYDASNGTTFNGKITAYAGVVTNSISDGSESFRVSDAKDVIDAVNNSHTGLEATNDLAKKNETAIASLGTKVDTFDGRITKNTDDIGTLNTKTTGMSYDASSGTTFAQAVTANDFKIGNTSLNQVAQDVNNTTSGLAATYKIATDNQTAINDPTTGLKATYDIAGANKQAIENADTGLGAAHTKINALQKVTTGMSYDASSGTTFAQAVTATDFKIGNTSLNQVAQDVNNATTGLKATYDIADANKQAIENADTGLAAAHTKIGKAEGEIDTLQKVTTGMSYDASSGTKFAQAVTATDFKIGNTSLNQVAQDVNNTTTGLGATYKIATDNQKDITALETKTQNISTDGNSITNLTNLSTANLTATTGTIGSVTFTGGTATGLTNIAGDSVTVAGTAISNGSFNGVTIADYNTNGSHGATINSVSIYKDSSNDYWVGNVNISDLTSGSGVTIEGIKRTDNGTGGHITTIEENLAINSNGEISNHNDSFKVDADGNVTATNVVTGKANLNTIASQVNDPTTGLKATYDIADANKQAIENADTGLAAAHTKIGKAEGEIDTLQKVTTGMSYDASSGTKFAQAVTATDFKIGNTSLNQVAQDVNNTTTGLAATYKIATDNHTAITNLDNRVDTAETNITALNNKTHNISTDGNSITNLTNLSTANLTATTGTIGSVTFNGGTATGLTNIDGDVVTVAGTAISNGSFNGVSIGKVDDKAAFNGVKIYQDNQNDYIVGDVNISALKGVSGTEIEGIKRTPNTGGGFTTTIEENLAVSTDGTIKQTKGAFTVDDEGEVTGKDFVIDGTNTTLSGVATDVSSLNQKTTGMTYTPAGSGTVAITSFDHEVQATNITTTTGADLNELSATVGDANSGLVQNVNALNTKTTNLSADGSTLTGMTNIESAAGTIGGMTFATVNGMKTIGSADDTITVAGAEITSNSFNNVEIYQNDENSHYFVGDVDVSALQSGSAEITNKLRGITYSNESGNDYTMTFAGVMSVSTEGEYKFKYNGNEYGLDDLINTVDVGDLDKIKDLAGRVDKLEDKTTGIEFNEETGSTTITDMNKNGNEWEKGDNSLTVGDGGITANGDTVINGDTDDNTTGGNGNGSSDPQGGDSIINGYQLVNGDQHVTGDSQFDGTVTVGTGTDGNGQTVINGGTINTGNTVINGGQVKADEGHFGNITVGEGDNKTTIGESGIQVGNNTTIDNSGVSIKDENGNVFMGDHDVVIKDSEGNVEASLSDVANRVDGIEQSIGDLNSRMGELEDRIDKVGAMAAAIANLRTMGYDPAAPTEVAVGIGQYRNETGAALGLFHYPNRDFMLSLSVSTSGDEVMGGIGATWKFGRKSPEKVAAEKAEKAREAKLQKAEAIKEAARLKKIEAQQERHAKLAAQKTATK